MVELNWTKNLTFEAATPTGNRLTLDAYPEEGKPSQGPTPVEALLAAIGGCSAMDVLSILAKKKQVVTEYRIEVDGDRTQEGVYPRPFASLRVKHILKGENLDPVAVARAVELSDQKYCTVVSTLRSAPSVEATWVIAD